MKRVAILTGRTYRGARFAAGELPAYERADFTELNAAAQPAGIALEVRFWDEPDLAAQGFAAALIRSCWDYTNDVARFLAALEALQGAGTPVFNPPALVAWNVRKRYLEDLAAAGVATIPTIWADQVDALTVSRAFEAFNAAEIVIKPQVGAGGVRTIRLRRGAWGAGDLASAPLGPAMLQPFLPAIETDGETSMFFFGGALSHVLRKRPAPGGWLANAADIEVAIADPSPAECRLAEQALAAVPIPPLYARIDLVPGASSPLLIEFEAIEPRLWLDLAPQGAVALTRALAAKI